VIPLLQVISGGQTGVDQIGLAVARSLGYQTGGTAPRGWQTDDGPMPALLKHYGLVECRFKGYSVRTQMNVKAADLTVWFGHVDSPGGIVTAAAARRLSKPFLVNPTAAALRLWLEITDQINAGIGDPPLVSILNVAGNRYRKNPAASVVAYQVLTEALGRSC
jgi:hypothetical protein